MPLRIRFQYDHGSTLGYSVERLRDGRLFDFASADFSARPADPIADLPEGSHPFVGRYSATLAPTPGRAFNDGDYCVSIHDAADGDRVVASLATTMFRGDDATLLPGDARLATGPLNPIRN